MGGTGRLGGTHDRPYVDAPVSDLTAAAGAARAAAAHWDLPQPVLLRRGMNAIFTSGDLVLRVGSPTAAGSASIELAHVLTARSLPVPEPARDDALDHEGFTVTCWHRISPVAAPVDWAAIGRLVRAVHQLDPADLPAGYPLPSPARFPWWDFETMLADVGDDVDAPALEGIRRTVVRHRDWSRFAPCVVCHGDVHPGNVLMSADGPVLLDWDLLCLAPPGWDHAPLMRVTDRWGGPSGLYESFARGYGRSFRGDQAAEGWAELRLVAATLLRLRAARTDPAARSEVERRLAYWRGDPDAPTWSAQ